MESRACSPGPSPSTPTRLQCCTRTYALVLLRCSRPLRLVATKDYYFGVGGGRFVLEQLLARSFPHLRCVMVRHYDDGSSNVRSILAVLHCASGG